MAAPPPHLSHILETILYVRSMKDSMAFYRDVLNLACVNTDGRIAVFPLGAGVLLLFQLGLTTEDYELPDDGGLIPRHGPTEPLLPYLVEPGTKGDGEEVQGKGDLTLTVGGEHLRQHFCFAVNSADEVEAWDAHLVSKGVTVSGRVTWPDGRGKSVYFADPDGNVGEVASKGLWDKLRKGRA